MFCDECFGAAARADSSCVPVQEAEQESLGGTADYRGRGGSAEGGGFDSVAVAASDGLAGDASGEGAAGGSGRPKGAWKALQGLRREQEDDPARIFGRDQNEFREVAATAAATAWVAAPGFGREGDGGGVGGGL